MATPDYTTKQCTKCEQWFPATTEYFYRDKSTRDGFRPDCKVCATIPVKREKLPKGQKRCVTCKNIFPSTSEYFAIRSRSGNSIRGECRECYHKRQQQWRKEHQQEYLNYHKQYREENAEQVAEVKADWYQEHKEEIRPKRYVTSKLWVERNREKVRLQHRVYAQRRKARLRNAEGTHTAEDIELLYQSQEGKCWWCGKKIKEKYHIDHRIPISRGGKNSADNLCISCVDCNQSKSDKMPWEWNGRLL